MNGDDGALQGFRKKLRQGHASNLMSTRSPIFSTRRSPH